MSGYYYRVRSTKKRSYQRGVFGVGLCAAALVAAVASLAPSLGGRFGALLHRHLFDFAGWSSLLIPVYLGWIGVKHLFKKTGEIRDSILFAVLFVFLGALFSLFHDPASGTNGAGGALGDRVSLILVHQFGAFLTFLFSAAILFVAGSLLAGLSPAALLALLREKIIQDIRDWQVERNKLLEKNALKKKIERSEAKEKTAQLPEGRPKIVAPEPLQSSAPSKAPAGQADGTGSAAPAKAVLPKITETAAQEAWSAKAGASPAPAAKKAKPPEAAAEKKPALAEEAPRIPPADPYLDYRLPDPDLLSVPEQNAPAISKEELYANGTLLEQTLEQFNVKAKVIDIHPGPVITRYDLTPAAGVRVQQIEALADDIALAMKAQSLRVLAPVPGKAAVGIEISNPHPAFVYFKEIIQSKRYRENGMEIPFAMGKTTEGEPWVSDLAAMPHLLVAGATGSGKSVCVHALILSILYRFKPDQVKLLLIDPKRLELPAYDQVPHLYDPASAAGEVRVITQPKETVESLKKLVEVMEERYKNFARMGVRNIQSYNEKAKAKGIMRVPYIIVVIDELADLMVVVGKEIEDLIQRLAQMARAVGIHLVLATQRPSVDVITGVIKANLPSRIAFQVLSKTDSRVILDSQGAEDLLGKGDMLFLATGAPRPVRLQGALVSEADVSRVIQFIQEQGFKPSYEIVKVDDGGDSIVDNDENRELLVRAARVVRDTEKVSGDLLRADKEIGSRYDLALSLLKKKGLIEKPKDSNRWKIHFDRLEEFLVSSEKREE